MHNEYVNLAVKVYGSEKCALKKAHVDYCQSHSAKWCTLMLIVILGDHKLAHGSEPNMCKLNRRRYRDGNTWMGGTHCMIKRQQMDCQSDRVDNTRMDKTAGKT